MSLRPIVQFTFSLMKQIFLHASLCARLAIRLLDHLCRGTKTWVIMLLRLLSFTVLLTPGWYQLVMYWLFDKNIRRNVAYSSDGASQRHLLDLYLPLPSSCCCCNSTAFTHNNNNTASTSTGNSSCDNIRVWRRLDDRIQNVECLNSSRGGGCLRYCRRAGCGPGLHYTTLHYRNLTSSLKAT